jgi:excisionase family DNA binding protein
MGQTSVGSQLGNPRDAAAPPASEATDERSSEQDRVEGASNKMPPDPGLILSNRLALRPAEAARVLGVSPSTLRRLLPEIPHVRLAGAVLVPVDGLRRWLEEQAKREAIRIERIAREISSAFE